MIVYLQKINQNAVQPTTIMWKYKCICLYGDRVPYLVVCDSEGISRVESTFVPLSPVHRGSLTTSGRGLAPVVRLSRWIQGDNVTLLPQPTRHPHPNAGLLGEITTASSLTSSSSVYGNAIVAVYIRGGASNPGTTQGLCGC